MGPYLSPRAGADPEFVSVAPVFEVLVRMFQPKRGPTVALPQDAPETLILSPNARAACRHSPSGCLEVVFQLTMSFQVPDTSTYSPLKVMYPAISVCGGGLGVPATAG
jgi:hypothetical protein